MKEEKKKIVNLQDQVRAAQKDLSLAGPIVEAFTPLIYASLYKFIPSRRDPHLREEWYQQGVLQVLEAIQAYEEKPGHPRFEGYLKSRLYYYYLGLCQARQEIPVDSQEILESTLAAEDSTEERVLLQEDVRLLYQGLASCSPRQKEILTAYYLEDLTYQEIADQTGLSPSSIQTHKERGLARLQEFFLARRKKTTPH